MPEGSSCSAARNATVQYWQPSNNSASTPEVLYRLGFRDPVLHFAGNLGLVSNGPTKIDRKTQKEVPCFGDCYNVARQEIPKFCQTCTAKKCLPDWTSSKGTDAFHKTYWREMSKHCLKEGIDIKRCCMMFTQADEMKLTETIIPVQASWDKTTGTARVQQWALATPQAITTVYANKLIGITSDKWTSPLPIAKDTIPAGYQNLRMVWGDSGVGSKAVLVAAMQAWLKGGDLDVCSNMSNSPNSRCGCTSNMV